MESDKREIDNKENVLHIFSDKWLGLSQSFAINYFACCCVLGQDDSEPQAGKTATLIRLACPFAARQNYRPTQPTSPMQL